MPDRPTFSLCHASARPKAWHKAHTQWMTRADDPTLCEYVLCVDEPQVQDFVSSDGALFPSKPELFPPKPVINPGPFNAATAWNVACAASTGKFICQVADDVFPPAHWDTELLKALEAGGGSLDGEWVLEVKSGTSPADDEWFRCMVHSFLTRKYYERYGYLFYPEYQGMYADVDWTEVARRDGVVIDARHLTFQHVHFIGGGAVQDEVYSRQNAQERYDEGLAILGKRRASGYADLRVAK